MKQTKPDRSINIDANAIDRFDRHVIKTWCGNQDVPLNGRISIKLTSAQHQSYVQLLEMLGHTENPQSNY